MFVGFEELLLKYSEQTGRKIQSMWVCFFFKGMVCSPLKSVSISPYSHVFGQTEPCAHSLRCFCYKCWDNLSMAALAQVMSELAQ